MMTMMPRTKAPPPPPPRSPRHFAAARPASPLPTKMTTTSLTSVSVSVQRLSIPSTGGVVDSSEKRAFAEGFSIGSGGTTTMSTTTSTSVRVSSMRPLSKEWWYETSRACFAEFVGDFMFVFIGSMAIGPSVAFAHGLTICLLVISLGHISGGHFNPAVTLGVALSSAIHPVRAALYVVFQLLGGFIGALFVRVLSPNYSVRNGITTLGDQPNVNAISPGQGIVLEILLTYFLVLTVLCAAVDSDGKNVLAPLAIGFTLVVDILAGGDLTGASMNPARSLGPSIAASIFGDTNRDPWEYHYVYWAGPIGGSVIAALFYRLLLAKEERRLLF